MTEKFTAPPPLITSLSRLSPPFVSCLFLPVIYCFLISYYPPSHTVYRLLLYFVPYHPSSRPVSRLIPYVVPFRPLLNLNSAPSPYHSTLCPSVQTSHQAHPCLERHHRRKVRSHQMMVTHRHCWRHPSRISFSVSKAQD